MFPSIDIQFLLSILFAYFFEKIDLISHKYLNLLNNLDFRNLVYSGS